MPRSATEIRVRQVRMNGRNQTQIEVREGNGPWHTYADLNAVPAPWQPLVARLLRFEAAVPSSDMPDITTASPRPAYKSRRRRPAELTLNWFDPWVALGAFAIVAWPLWAQWRQLLGQAAWNFWTPPALLLAALGMYLLLAFLFNRTTFHVADGGLSVSHGPLPWPGNRQFDRNELLQLFVRVRLGSRTTEYALCALTTTGQVQLAGSLRHPEELRRLELEIEERLGILDQPVRGSQYR